MMIDPEMLPDEPPLLFRSWAAWYALALALLAVQILLYGLIAAAFS